MKGKMKKGLLLFVGSLLLATTSCVQKTGDDTNGRERSFTFCYYDSAYGSSWIDAVIKDYTENVNKNVWINTRASTDNEDARTKIKAGVGTFDLYQIEVGMFNNQDYLEPLDDLMDTDLASVTANFDAADQESSVKVKDKIGANMISFYTEGDHIYQMNQTSGTGWNWAYNQDTLDEALGAGNYQLPKTTDEFFKMGDDLYSKGIYLTAFPGSDTKGGEYTRYAYKIWFAQRMGLTARDHYFKGEVLGSDGTYARDEEEPKMVTDNRKAIEDTYQVVTKLCTPSSNGQYMHNRSSVFQYRDVDSLLYGAKYKGQTVPKIAFHYVGGWLENEVQSYINAGTIKDGQNIRAMKMPVISSIIDRLPTVNDDATLSKVVSYVDGEGEAPAGVSEDDIAAVREARNLIAELNCREFVIPKSAKNKEDIKNFLAYLTTKRAQRIAAKACNGTNTLPYGYVPTEEDMGFKLSNYKKDYQKLSQECQAIDVSNSDNSFALFMNIEWCTNSNGLTLTIFNGTAQPLDKIYEATYGKLKPNWKTMIAQYKNRYGEN